MTRVMIDDDDKTLLWQLETGLPLVSRPYAEIGDAIGMEENEVISRLKRMIDRGVIRRFGVVVRHHEVGYGANAMVVWDVSDDRLEIAVHQLTRCEHVTLCYQRPRRLPEWPYNLFSMIHGTDEAEVRAEIDRLRLSSALSDVKHAVLFSRRRFKQTGAKYQPVSPESEKREVA